MIMIEGNLVVVFSQKQNAHIVISMGLENTQNDLKLRRSCLSDLEAAHSQIIFITRVACETEDRERDRGRGQTGQR